MVTTRSLTMEEAGTIANQYISNVLGESHYTYNGEATDGGYGFRVACKRDDPQRDLAVGSVHISAAGEIVPLSDEQICDMKEAAETQVAQKKSELARDKDGHILRYHARIKATSWLAKKVDHKIGAKGGIFVPIESPIWRFLVYDLALLSDAVPLGVIDVNAVTGEVLEPDDEEIEIIIRSACASRKYPQHTATGRS